MHVHRLIAAKSIRHFALAALFGVAALGACHPAAAQTRLRLPDFSSLFVPEFTSDQLPLMSDVLELRDDQKVVVETLLKDYDTAFAKGVVEVRQRITEQYPLPNEVDAKAREVSESTRRELQETIAQFQRAQAEGHPEDIAELKKKLEALQARSREQMEALQPRPLAPAEVQAVGEAVIGELLAWRERRDEIRSTLVDGMVTVLDKQQMPRWTIVDQRLRRESELSDSRLSGEAIDLVAQVEALSLDAQTLAALQPTIDAYAAALDAALREKREFLELSSFEMYRAVAASDPSRATKIVDHELALRQAIRGINGQYATTIADALDEARRATFTSSVRLAGFPRVYRPTRSHEAIMAAMSLDGVPSDVMSSLTTLIGAYDKQYANVTASIYQATWDHEPAQERVKMLHRFGIVVDDGSGDEIDPIQSAYQQRTDLDRRVADRVHELLGDELFARLGA